MSRNSSSFNEPLLYANLSSTDFHLPFNLDCILSRPSSFIFSTFNIITFILLLPLCILILYCGLQEWWQKHSSSSATIMTHSDCFTYHMVIMELISIFGCILCFCAIYMDDIKMLLVGGLFYSFIWSGETFFHVLTCVDHYLAVVHPFTYLSLRQERWIKIRNIITGCAWLFCFAGMGLVMKEKIFIIVNLCLLMSSLTIVSLCSLSILCALIRSGPGEQGKDRKRVDQSKQRAFYTIVAILGVLVLRFASGLVRTVMYISGSTNCVFLTCLVWINIPSNLVLPLLYLHRIGKIIK